MLQKAYISLTDDDYWGLYLGDGSETTPCLLALGQPFKPDRAIRDAVNELVLWAFENGYEVEPAHYSLTDVVITDIIEPEVFIDVFGTLDLSQQVAPDAL